MNVKMKRTMLALAIVAMFGSTMAYAADDEDASANINHQHLVNDNRTHTNTVVNDTTNTTHNTTLSLDAAAKLRLDAAARLRLDDSRTNSVSNKVVNEDTNINSDIRREGNSHNVDVNLKKSLSLTTDVRITGRPTISGEINTDSAAIAVIDNRQSISNNEAYNDKLTNSSSIENHVAADASGNIGMNVAAGDNNTQDNAASLSATDASFAFGMADAEVFVNQNGSSNYTMNYGVTNSAGISNNAFNGAAGNIGVNVASGNNNEQKNALAASVATTNFAQSSISSNQVSSGNYVSNNGTTQEMGSTVDVSLSGSIWGSGTYSGSSRGDAYQMANFYPDNWNGNVHPSGSQVGHSDWDGATQGAVPNRYRAGQAGFAMDTGSDERGDLGFGDIEDPGLAVSLAGTVNTTQFVVMDATNTAGLSGNAFRNASGNIGVNVASGTGNLQANSLALAVAQPSTSTPPGGGGGE